MEDMLKKKDHPCVGCCGTGYYTTRIPFGPVYTNYCMACKTGRDLKNKEIYSSIDSYFENFNQKGGLAENGFAEWVYSNLEDQESVVRELRGKEFYSFTYDLTRALRHADLPVCESEDEDKQAVNSWVENNAVKLIRALKKGLTKVYKESVDLLVKCPVCKGETRVCYSSGRDVQKTLDKSVSLGSEFYRSHREYRINCRECRDIIYVIL